MKRALNGASTVLQCHCRRTFAVPPNLFRSKKKSDVTDEYKPSGSPKKHAIEKLMEPKKKKNKDGELVPDNKEYFIDPLGAIFGDIDMSDKRIAGPYYRITRAERKQFHDLGYAKLDRILTTDDTDTGELLDLRLGINGIFSGLVKPDQSKVVSMKVPSITPNMLPSSEDEGTSKIAATAQDPSHSLEYGDYTSLERISEISGDANSDSLGNQYSFRGNWFDSRCLSISRQLFAEELSKRKKKCDLQCVSSNLLLLESHLWKANEADSEEEQSETERYPNPLLVPVFSPFRETETPLRRLRVSMIMPVFGPAVLTMRLMNDGENENLVDERKVMPNVALVSGNVLIFDPRRIDQVLYWKIQASYNAFFTNTLALHTA